MENLWSNFFKIKVKNWKHVWSGKGYYLMGADDRDIWFKLKYKILPTKDKLKKWGMINRDVCNLCNLEVETL